MNPKKLANLPDETLKQLVEAGVISNDEYKLVVEEKKAEESVKQFKHELSKLILKYNIPSMTIKIVDGTPIITTSSTSSKDEDVDDVLLQRRYELKASSWKELAMMLDKDYASGLKDNQDWKEVCRRIIRRHTS